MHRILILLITCALLGCAHESEVTFETLQMESEPCRTCPEVKITLPEAGGKSRLARAVNTALREEVIALLTFEDSMQVRTLEEAMRSFHQGYNQLRSLYPDEAAGWKAEIFGEVSYEDQHWISIKLHAYTFTGGAHGYSMVRFLNFNKQKGSEMESWELFRNQNGFLQLAEEHFRQQEKIPPGTSINSTGFMFEEDQFYLPENIGLTAKGITLHYNQYEIAAYADGPVELILPYREAAQYLALPGKS